MFLLPVLCVLLLKIVRVTVKQKQYSNFPAIIGEQTKIILVGDVQGCNKKRIENIE